LGDFSQEEYLPKKADWEGFFENLMSQCHSPERLRTYWYVIEQVDFYPYRFPEDEPTLIKLLSKHPPYRDELSRIKDGALVQRIKQIVDELKERERDFRRRFEGWIEIQNGIAQKHKGVEFRRAGAIRYNLFDKSLGQEKAVDVKLAVDLLELRNIYEVAIIVSGDQDYVPAVQAIKDSGKRVINVCFLTRDGHYLPGGARRLNQITDEVLEIKYDGLKKFLIP
jgi:uncharacterized LabA/DUF88 family protein